MQVLLILLVGRETLRYPNSLSNNGKIGFIAPSFAANTEPYHSLLISALDKWEKEGYTLLQGPNCFAGEGVGISNIPEKCGAEVNDMFASDADVVLSVGGGELMCEILPYVDFEKLAQLPPKWFMGYSDNTNLTYLLATLCDTASVYGPCAGSFGTEEVHKSLTDAMEILRGERKEVGSYGLWEIEKLKSADNPLVGYNLTEPLAIKTFVGKEEKQEKVSFEGRLIGGCLDCLVTLLGTRFDKTKEFMEKYKEDGFVWFLEACDLNVFSIRRAMWQMREAGWLKYVKGFLIGRPLNGEEMINLNHVDAFLEVAGEFGVPVLMDIDLGHLPPAMPLVTGSMAAVTCEGNDLKIVMEYR